MNAGITVIKKVLKKRLSKYINDKITNNLNNIKTEIYKKINIITNNKKLLIDTINELRLNNIQTVERTLEPYEKKFIFNKKNNNTNKKEGIVRNIDNLLNNPKDYNPTEDDIKTLPNINNIEQIIYNLLTTINTIIEKKNELDINNVLIDLIGAFSGKTFSDIDKQNIEECISTLNTTSGRGTNPIINITKLFNILTNPSGFFDNCEKLKDLKIDIDMYTVIYIIDSLFYKLESIKEGLSNINESNSNTILQNLINNNPSIFLIIKNSGGLNILKNETDEEIINEINRNIDDYSNEITEKINGIIEKSLDKIGNKYYLDNEDIYYEKYIKYKSKYLELKYKNQN